MYGGTSVFLQNDRPSLIYTGVLMKSGQFPDSVRYRDKKNTNGIITGFVNEGTDLLKALIKYYHSAGTDPIFDTVQR